MAMKQEANAPLILTIGAISGLLILVVMFGVEAWFRHEERTELDSQWDHTPNTWLINLREGQKAHIAGIDGAMKQIVENGGKLPSTQPSSSGATAAAQ